MTARVLLPGLAGCAQGELLPLSEESTHHLLRVLRLEDGAPLTLFDGAGLEAGAVLRVVGPRAARAHLAEAPREGVAADSLRPILLQGVPKSDKLELLLRPCTELGLAALWPVYTERSVPRPSRPGEHRAERLTAIAASAAAQCRRAEVPEVRTPGALRDAFEQLPREHTLRLVAWEEGGLPLREAVAHRPPGAKCVLLVGPEGGLTREEVALAREHGFTAITLGPRVLRTETAAVALLAAVSALCGELGGPTPPG